LLECVLLLQELLDDGLLPLLEFLHFGIEHLPFALHLFEQAVLLALLLIAQFFLLLAFEVDQLLFEFVDARAEDVVLAHQFVVALLLLRTAAAEVLVEVVNGAVEVAQVLAVPEVFEGVAAVVVLEEHVLQIFNAVDQLDVLLDHFYHGLVELTILSAELVVVAPQTGEFGLELTQDFVVELGVLIHLRKFRVLLGLSHFGGRAGLTRVGVQEVYPVRVVLEFGLVQRRQPLRTE